MRVSVEKLREQTNQQPAEGRVNRAIIPQREEEALPPQQDSVIETITRGNVIGEDENLEKRREMLDEVGFEPTEFAFERSIGENDSLYSNFTELIALTKRKVGRIVIIRDNKKAGYATGFMVAPNLLLTNWHVFKSEHVPLESELHFFYEYDSDGHPVPPVIFRFDAEKFFVNHQQLDYCFVAVQPMDVTGKFPLDKIGYLYLNRGLGKLGEVNKEKLNIIHHPNGDFKQISIRANLFVAVDNTRIYYETDTAQGSSGSPVFNDQWQVVGLHHKSIGLMSEDGLHYLDKDTRQPIPVVNGKIDVSRVKWLRNEGIRISVILNHLSTLKPDNSYVKSLEISPPKEVFRWDGMVGTIAETNKNIVMPNESQDHINISVPVKALNTENTIDISLSSRKNLPAGIVVGTDSSIPGIDTAKREAFQEEIATEVKEDNVDFSECSGYDPDFLGVNVPLPQPRKSILKRIAKLSDNTIELKYFKYSVIFNAAASLPLISAVNADGDSELRKDDSKRNDDWLRDKRIDRDCQLTNKFYSKSGFDKGHMSRFEDANWDTTEAKALRNGIYTCFYTNACPQVPGINRIGDNLWGKLEKAVLEKGIKKQAGRQARMTVFNGPIFDDDKDRVRKGVTIPMQFYKIIVWLNDGDELKVTGFRLSQELLVTDDQFDEALMLGEEAIDIDQLVTYKKYQAKIRSLGKATKINFSHLEEFDTYRPGVNEEEVLLEDEEAIML